MGIRHTQKATQRIETRRKDLRRSLGTAGGWCAGQTQSRDTGAPLGAWPVLEWTETCR
jgi:hypothetical protein